MGTRAMISVDGKPFVTTHWDGYPTQLGKDLLKAKSKEEILRQAVKRSLNFADSSILQKANKMALARIRRMPKSERSGYGWALKSGKFVDDMKTADDFFEWQYDFNTKTGKWQARKVNDSWKQRKPEKWGSLENVLAGEVAKEKAYLEERERKAKLQQVV